MPLTLSVEDLDHLADALAARLNLAAPGAPRAGALLTKPNAADYLGETVRTVQHLIETGQIEPVHLGRSVRVRRSDLDRLVADGSSRPDKPRRRLA